MKKECQFKTIVHCLTEWAIDRPNAAAFCFLNEEGEIEETLDFEDLHRKATCIAFHLQALQLHQQPVVLFFSSNSSFISAFLGCLYAGAIAVPIPPPQGKRQSARVQNVLLQSKASHILTTKEIRTHMLRNSKWIERLNPSWIDYDQALAFQDPVLSLKAPSEEQIAFLQYTSGSTSTPKGVIITHGNLMRNEEQIASAFKHDESTIVIGWLPFYHDMGLIGNILQPLYLGVSAFLMAPASFLQNPFLWLQAISKYRGTTSGGPNFAYELCLNQIRDENLKDLDLSSWKIAFNGSEFIRAKTLTAFAKKFEVCGFQPSSSYPCYGLAESTLFVTGGEVGSKANIRLLHLETENRNLDIVSCGFPQKDCDIKIVNPQTLALVKEGEVGEIWLGGASIAQGYWNLAQETSEVFQAYTAERQGPYLRTGDLGVLDQGELYLAGRLKNMLIIRGKNFYPHDIEYSLIGENELLKGCAAAAFSVSIENNEELVVLLELDRKKVKETDFSVILKFAKKEIGQSFQIDPYAIILVKPGGIPRTTSGKIQHHLCRQMFLENTLPTISCTIEGFVTDSSKPASFLDSLAKILNIAPQQLQDHEMLIHYGLDSIKAVQLQNWLKRQYGVSLPFESFFEDLTVRDVLAITKGGKQEPSISFPFANSLTTAPMSYNQREVWLAHQIEPTRIDYHIPVILKLKGSLDRMAFIQALQELSNRHSILKTCFSFKDDSLVQCIQDHLALPIILEESSGQNQELIFNKMYQSLVEIPFSLNEGPLWRVGILSSSEDHVIIFNFHHMICDGWSMGVFANELFALYAGHLAGKKATLPALESDYSHFSLWQEQFSQTEEWQQLKVNWKNDLGHLDECSILAISHEHQPIKAVHHKKGKNIQMKIETSLFDEIQHFIYKSHCTLACFLLAVYHALLHRYSDQSTILIGYPSANRASFEFQNVLGFFVNTLVNKTTFSPHTTFEEVLQQVKEGLQKGIKNEALPFQEILNAVNPKRIDGVHPLFQVMFVMQNAPVEIPHFPNATVEIVHPSDHPVLYDLVLEVRQKSQHLALLFEYREERLPTFLVEQFAEDYMTLIKQVLRFSDQPVQAVQFMHPSLVQMMTIEWNKTHVELPAVETVFDLIKEQAQQHPDAIAVIAEGKEMSYRELLEASQAIAQALLLVKGREGEAIGLAMEKTRFLIPTLLAIMQCGCAYVPLDPSYPQERIEWIIKEAKIDILICQTTLLNRFAYFKGTLIDPAHLPEKSSVKLSPISNLRNQLAYLLFTSGSTGQPKGVAVEHHSLLNFALAAKTLFEMTSKDHCLQFASISWDTSSEEIYPCLLAGGTVVLRGNALVEPFDQILEMSHQYEISIWNFPTSYWHDFTDYLIQKNLSLPSSLRLLIIGGERLNKYTLQKWKSHFGHQIKLLNTYGATEATSISCACHLIETDIEQAIPIGKPLQNVRCFVLNPYLQVVPIGVAGELYIGGEGLAREYINLPELTKSKFLSHPETGERIYKTGDKAYYDKNGTLFLLGRLDGQIKRRGFRIEPEEIQANIDQLEEVGKSLIICRQEMNQNSTEIAAFIIPAHAAMTQHYDEKRIVIKEKLRKKLPPYLMPDAFLFIEEFPRLPNGKINYPALYLQLNTYRKKPASFQDDTYSEIQIQILQIWKSVLPIAHIQLHDSFFEIGGNSLLIVKLHQLFQDQFNLKINIADLFIHHTCQAQGQMIEMLKQKQQNTVERTTPSSDKTLNLLQQLAEGAVDIQTVKNNLTY